MNNIQKAFKAKAQLGRGQGLRMVDGGQPAQPVDNWQQQKNLANAQTSASSMIHDGAQRAGAAQVAAMTAPVQVPTGPGVDRAGYLARNPNAGGPLPGVPAVPGYVPPPLGEARPNNPSTYVAPGTTGAPPEQKGLRTDLATPGSSPIYQHSANSYGDTAVSPWRTTDNGRGTPGHPNAAVDFDAGRLVENQPLLAYNAPSLRMAEGGMFDGVKRMVGLGPEETITQKYARQDAERAAKAPKPAPVAAPAPVQDPAPQKAITQYASGGNTAAQMKALGLRDGGDMRTGQGGQVPSDGHTAAQGDTIPAKYTPGEFVVSNAMLDAQPGLREQLHDLRGNVLHAQGKSVAATDAAAYSGGHGQTENQNPSLRSDNRPDSGSPGDQEFGHPSNALRVARPTLRANDGFTFDPKTNTYSQVANGPENWTTAPGAAPGATEGPSFGTTGQPRSPQPSLSQPSAPAPATPKYVPPKVNPNGTYVNQGPAAAPAPTPAPAAPGSSAYNAGKATGRAVSDAADSAGLRGRPSAAAGALAGIAIGSAADSLGRPTEDYYRRLMMDPKEAGSSVLKDTLVRGAGVMSDFGAAIGDAPLDTVNGVSRMFGGKGDLSLPGGNFRDIIQQNDNPAASLRAQTAAGHAPAPTANVPGADATMPGNDPGRFTPDQSSTPTLRNPDTPAIWAQRKADRDALTQADIASVNRSQADRASAEAANSSAQWQKNQAIKNDWDNDRRRQAAEVTMSSFINNPAARAQKAVASQTLAGLDGRELQQGKDQAETLRNGMTNRAQVQVGMNRNATDLRGHQLQYDAATYGHQLSAQTARSRLAYDDGWKRAEFGQANDKQDFDVKTTAQKNVGDQIAGMIPGGADGKPDTATTARYMTGLNALVGNRQQALEVHLQQNPNDAQARSELMGIQHQGLGTLGQGAIRKHVAGMQVRDIINSSATPSWWPVGTSAVHSDAPVTSMQKNSSGDYVVDEGGGKKTVIPGRYIDKVNSTLGMGGQQNANFDILTPH